MLLQKSFKRKTQFSEEYIYGEGDSAQKAYELILNTNFKDYVFKDERSSKGRINMKK